MSDRIQTEYGAPPTPLGQTAEELPTFNAHQIQAAIIPPPSPGPFSPVPLGQSYVADPGGRTPPLPAVVIPVPQPAPAIAAARPLRTDLPPNNLAARQKLLWQIIATHGTAAAPVTAPHLLTLVEGYRPLYPGLGTAYRTEGALLTGLAPLLNAGLCGHDYVQIGAARHHRYWPL